MKKGANKKENPPKGQTSNLRVTLLLLSAGSSFVSMPGKREFPPMRRPFLLVLFLILIGAPIVFYCRQSVDLDSFGAPQWPLFGEEDQKGISLAHNDTPVQEPIDHTDPLDITRKLFYGPWRADIPQVVTADEDFKLTFFCTFPDQSLCPPYFMVMFHGPTRQTILPRNFTDMTPTNNSPHDYYSVHVLWRIRDPGIYKVYAYPVFVNCTQWDEMEYPWIRAAVEGTPFRLEVKPPAIPETEGFGNCSADMTDIYNGRYISSTLSPEVSALYNTSGREFIWAPYTCKIPHRTIPEAILELPKAKHFLWIGDSTTRGPFCTRVWESVHGTVLNSQCDYKSGLEIYWEMKWGHKFTHKIFDNDPQKRNLSFSFLWFPYGLDTIKEPLLAMKDPARPPPTHVVFNFGLWVAPWDVGAIAWTYKQFLSFMKDNFAGVTQHVILRTTTSINYSVNCIGGRNFTYSESGEIQPPQSQFDYRFGLSQKRHAVYEVARQFNLENVDNPPFKVSVVDAWQLTDNRPETTSEGRHWIAEDSAYREFRNGIGEGDDSALDIIWDNFIHERMVL